MCGATRPSRRAVAALLLAGRTLVASSPTAGLAETQAGPHRVPLPAVLSSDDSCGSGDEGGEAAPAGCALSALQLSLPRHAESSRREYTGIKVIGAGFPRTGTQSMAIALDLLGYHTVHGEHFEANRTMHDPWRDWAKGGPFEPALQSLLDGEFDATTADFPTGQSWKELLVRFPDGKVVLAVHPTGVDRWIHSIESLFEIYKAVAPEAYAMSFSSYKHFFGDYFEKKTWRTLELPFTPETRDKLRQVYEEFNAEVRQTVPPARLLDYNVSQGWEPLCAFLGKPVPSEPFPHIDSHHDMEMVLDAVGGAQRMGAFMKVFHRTRRFLNGLGFRIPEVPWVQPV